MPQLLSGIKEECVDVLSSAKRSVAAPTDAKRGAKRPTPDLPNFASMQQGRHAQRSEAFGCLSPTWQRARRGTTDKAAVKHEETTSEQQRG